MIQVKNLSKSYSNAAQEIKVLDDLSLEIQPSEKVAILGRSGSGKSTLLSLIGGLDRPNQGFLIVNDKVLFSPDGQMSESDLTDFRAQNIGIIFQNFHLLPHLTAIENVAIALEISKVESDFKMALSRAKRILSQVGLENRADHFPSMLSGGEKQRVAIARALVVDPKILLADEPSGSLDEATGREIMDLIFNLVEETKKTFVLVTHDKSLATQCDRVLELDRGRLC